MSDKVTISNPQEALEALREGNIRFQQNIKINRDYLKEVQATKDEQKPFAVIIGCMDSRTSVELLFDQGIGDVFSIRIAGNVITDEIIASSEFACHVAGASLVLVLGHTGCGAIRGAIDGVQFGHLKSITDRILLNASKGKKEPTTVALENVKSGVTLLKQRSSLLSSMMKDGKINIMGGLYDIATGEVHFFDH